MIHQHQRHHGFGNGGRSNADAGVMAAVGLYQNGLSGLIDRPTRHANTRGGLDGDGHHHLLAGGDTAENAARMIGDETLRCEFVAMLGSPLGHRGKTCPDFNRLHGVDAHHGPGQIRI